MTMHLFGTILTPQAVAHNNRGESEGTVSTLQKVIRNGDIYSTVSSEAIRYALRESWLSLGEIDHCLLRPTQVERSATAVHRFADRLNIGEGVGVKQLKEKAEVGGI